jgi:hypothetical protein
MIVMKALSVRQPYAMLIASGQKFLELRSRRTHYRGRLLICASAKKYNGVELQCGKHTTKTVGHALCIVELIDCRPMTPEDVRFSYASAFNPDMFVWEFKEAAVEVIKPFPVSGKLGIFDIALPAA